MIPDAVSPTSAPGWPPATPAGSLMDELASLLAVAGCADECTTIEVRRDPRPPVDIRMFLGDGSGRLSARLPMLEQALVDHPTVESTRFATKAGRATVSLRLADDRVRELGHATARSGPPMAHLAEVADARRWVVGFLGANASKGLHLGHLRNIVVGHATASLLAGVGLPTTAYSLVGDIGRTVCEALAGHDLGLAGPDPRATGAKPDLYVGACYRAYLARAAGADPTVADATVDPCRREYDVKHDLADKLLARWWAGDADTVERWCGLVAQVDEGHRATLRALGVTIDEWWPESEQLAHAVRIVDAAVERGVARRLPDGRVVFDSNCAGFPQVVLRRSDGFPTEHARVVAVFDRLFAEQPGPLVHVDYNGTEWEHAQAALTEFMAAMGLVPITVVHRPTIHGMVCVEGAELSSSRDEPPLIDDLLDAVVGSPRVTEVVGAADGAGACRAVVADLVVKTFFLSSARVKPLVYSWARLLDPATNPGWTVARAWCRHESGAGARSDRSHNPADPAYRLAVLQAQTLPLELTKSIEPGGDVDLSHLVSFLVHTARRLLDAPPGSAQAAVERSTLRRCLELLGFRITPTPGGQS